MLSPELSSEVQKQGVALDELAALLAPLAATHFGPDVRMECSVDGDRLLLLAALWIKPERGPGAVALDQVNARFGVGTFQLDDELMLQVFVTPDEHAQAVMQDAEYLELTGISSVGCGFFPVVRHAVEQRLGLDRTERALLQRALACAVDPDPRFVLRRTGDSELVLKELVEVRAGGEIEPFARGRRDLAPGSVVEVTRRTVTAEAVLAGLAQQAPQPELAALVKKVQRRAALIEHVATEAEGRFLT
jgi:hypothetical protein